VVATGQPHHEPGRVGGVRNDRCRDSRRLVPGGGRHHGLQVLPQGRRPPAGRQRGIHLRRGRRNRHRSRALRPPGVRPPRHHLAPLGREERLFRLRRRRPGVRGRAQVHARLPDGRPQQPPVVQHRPPPRLRHHRPCPGVLVRRPRNGRANPLPRLLLPPRPPCLLHPRRARRPGEPGRDHGPVDPGSPHLQVRLRRRLQLLGDPGRERVPLRRRQEFGRDELSQDRRPRRRGHQVGRHHPPGGQDGHPQRRPSRHRGLRRLEEGRRGQGSPPHPARGHARRLQRRSLRHRLRSELQQLGAGLQRLHPGRDGRRRLGAEGAHHRPEPQDDQGPRSVEPHRPGRLGLRRPGPPVRHDNQRVAHLAGGRAHQRLQPLQRVHVPRRHRLQPGLAQPGQVRDPRPAASTSTPTATPPGCGRSCSRSR
jgi:hypothetical protein